MNNNLTQKNKVTIIAGPCSIESNKQIEQVCAFLNNNGLSWIRGGAFKPRTNLHSFQGLGQDGLDILRKNARKFNLKSLTEITSVVNADTIYNYMDGAWIGTRNMTNYELLKECGRVSAKHNKPIMLKRGMASTINEWVSASEYITEFNKNIFLCERGIRTFETSTRFTLDISSVAVIKKQTNIPICVDVSHSVGHSDLVPSVACAALAAGADAIMIEVHPSPRSALSDGSQQLNFDQFENLLEKLRNIAHAINKEII